MLGVSQSNIAFWEQSDKPPRSDLLPKMADTLGVTVAELLNLSVQFFRSLSEMDAGCAYRRALSKNSITGRS